MYGTALLALSFGHLPPINMLRLCLGIVLTTSDAIPTYRQTVQKRVIFNAYYYLGLELQLGNVVLLFSTSLLPSIHLES